MTTSSCLRLIWISCLWAITILIQPAYAKEPKTVIVFGDSITEGGSLPPGDRKRVWVNLVQQKAGERLRLINEGKGGRPTASLKEFESMLTRHPRADELVLALGTNDSRDISEACVPKAVANVRKMVERARMVYGLGLGVTIVGPPNIRKASLGPTRPIAEQREKKLQELGAAFASLAKELGSGFVSLYGVVPDSSLTKDGVHPDVEGNVAIAKTMAKHLMQESP